MTAARVMIVLLVLVGVLFAVTIAVAHRTSGGAATSMEEWIDWVKTKTGDLARMEPEDVVCASRSNVMITLQAGVKELHGEVKSRKGKAVRRLGWLLQGNGAVDLHFEPNPGDDRALASTFHLDSKRTNTLVVMEPGGHFTLTRPNAMTKVVVELH